MIEEILKSFGIAAGILLCAVFLSLGLLWLSNL